MQKIKKLVQGGLICLSAVFLFGCAHTSETEVAKGSEPTPASATTSEPEARFVEGTFVAPGVDFSVYRRLIVADLGLADVDITLPAERRGETPWELTEQDKRFFRSEYTLAVVGNLIADGAYTTAINPAEDVLLVKSRIVQIASAKPAAPDENPGMALYQEGVGTMTISMELYDSMTNQLVGTIIATSDLGQMQLNNNRAATDVIIRQAFIDWLKTLRIELDTLAGRQSPLEHYLR